MRALIGALSGLALGVALACGADDGEDSAVQALPDAGNATTSEDAAPPDASARSTLRVLFIGNSYTYVNDVPGLLSRIAETSPAGPHIETASVVQGGWALQNHVDEGIAQTRIAEKNWAYVVLQGQSLEATQPEYFLPPAKTLADLATAAGAKPAWFVTWARAPEDAAYRSEYTGPAELQDRLTSGYDEAARRAPGSLLVCIGEAFRSSLALHPEIRLHQDDGSHATLAGSYLAASTFYVVLTGSPVPDSAEVPAGLDASQAATLRTAANIGSNCGDAHVNAAVHLSGAANIDGPDGGPPYDFGTAGTSIPLVLYLSNKGAVPTALSDGHTLAVPFGWTGGTFPGGASAPDAGPYPFCSTTLAPGETCKVSVSFSGKSAGSSRVTILTADAYQTGVTRALTGAATNRALLTVSEWVDDACLGCTPLYLSSNEFTFVVTNRGAIPTTSIGVGSPLVSPLSWGDAFPGGTGSGIPTFPPSSELPFCEQVLAPGAECVVRVHIDRPDAGASGGQVPVFDAGPPLERVVTLSYTDALGAITKYASRSVELR